MQISDNNYDEIHRYVVFTQVSLEADDRGLDVHIGRVKV